MLPARIDDLKQNGGGFFGKTSKTFKTESIAVLVVEFYANFVCTRIIY